MRKILFLVWNYFKDSWEGNDGKFSYKRASILMFVVMMVKLALFRITNEWEYYTFLTFAILFALQSSMITIQQLIMFAKTRFESTEDETASPYVEPLPEED